MLSKIRGLTLNTYGFLAPYEEKDSDDKKKRKANGFFKKHLGLVADDVAKVMPEVVEGLGYFSKKEADTDKIHPNLINKFKPDEAKRKTKMINMTHLQLYMLKALQELADEVDSLKGIKPAEERTPKKSFFGFFKQKQTKP